MDDDPDPQLDALTSEPPVCGEPRHTVLSPSGEYESTRDFARGLGPKRMKAGLAAGGGLVMLLALLAALQ